MAAGRAFGHALAPSRPALASRHLRGDTAFVQENQRRRVDPAGLLAPRAARELTRRGVLFGGVE